MKLIKIESSKEDTWLWEALGEQQWFGNNPLLTCSRFIVPN